MYAHFLEASPQISPSLANVKELMSDHKPSFDGECTPEVLLKPLPSSMRYEFFGPSSTNHVIFNANLTASQFDSLLKVLRLHRETTRYTIDDLKGLHPSIAMHRILIEEDHKPSMKHQKRLNPNMKEVVKKQILQLLEASIIYLIFNNN